MSESMYTRAARPTIVYFGLVAIALVHVLLPVVAWLVLACKGADMARMPTIQLPAEFWWCWTSVCSIWVIGRSAEKRGIANQAVELITGSKA